MKKTFIPFTYIFKWLNVYVYWVCVCIRVRVWTCEYVCVFPCVQLAISLGTVIRFPPLSKLQDFLPLIVKVLPDWFTPAAWLQIHHASHHLLVNGRKREGRERERERDRDRERERETLIKTAQFKLKNAEMEKANIGGTKCIIFRV